MIFRKLLKNRGVGLNLIAGFCFILLLVNGWGLRWSEIGGYLLVLLILLGGVIGLAALCGWLLHKLTRSSDVSVEQSSEKIDQLQDGEASDPDSKQ
ncbi:MAG: hypothetical protein Q7T48_13620 [Cellvibrio sp.]|uniref:hypothetical protein n=1 Tax=Cellvibrio sp. TaxID=1965322 RepID=UPI002726FFD9|nr:hypothetical protein [Cellvibrio sp.]